jgi:hypothetical protein
MKLRFAMLAAIVATPGVAQAQPQPARALAPAPAASAAQVHPTGTTALRINRFVGMEAQAPRDANAFSRGLQHELDRDRQGAAFGVAYMPVARRAQVFARVGYGGGSGLERSTVGEAFKFGAGAQYSPNTRNGFRADFTRYDPGKTRPKANLMSLGFVQKF